MACERSCSVTMSDRRVTSQHHKFVIVLGSGGAIRPTALAQWFPTGVPRNPRAPFAIPRGVES